MALHAGAEYWLNAIIPGLGNKAPLDLAESSEMELVRALGALDQESHRQRKLENDKQTLRVLRTRLLNDVTYILGEAAQPFLASPYQELGGKKAADFCINETTFQNCIELAQKIKRKRR